jgi:hypothetical protein
MSGRFSPWDAAVAGRCRSNRSNRNLSTGAFHKHVTTVERFHQHQPNAEQMTTMLTTHLLTYGTLAERQREQLRLLLNYMSRCNEKRD